MKYLEILINLQDIPCIIKSELIEIILAKIQKPPKHGEINQFFFGKIRHCLLCLIFELFLQTYMIYETFMSYF